MKRKIREIEDPQDIIKIKRDVYRAYSDLISHLKTIRDSQIEDPYLTGSQKSNLEMTISEIVRAYKRTKDLFDKI